MRESRPGNLWNAEQLPRGFSILLGVDIGERFHDKIRGELQKIDPPVSLELKTVDAGENRAVLHIQVPGNTGLYRYEGRPYVRFGASTSLMPEETYQQRLLERRHSITRWENQPASHFSIDDLDHQEITRTINEAVTNGRLTDPETRDPYSLLQGMNLIVDDQLLNAAVVLFGNPQRLETWYPQCRLRMARFRGTSKAEFIDNRQAIGNNFELIRRAQQFLLEHIPVASRIDPGQLERIDTPLYPPEAWREALVNAFTHRDFAEAGGSVDIAIFEDRLEITSKGGLRFGLTVENLLQSHQSRPWNPLVNHAFYLRGLIENWGRGTIRIIELATRAGLPQPQFEDQRIASVVRLLSSYQTPPVPWPDDLTPLQIQVLSVLQENGPLSISQIDNRLPVAVGGRGIQRVLRSLREYGLIELIGEKRGARWMRAK